MRFAVFRAEEFRNVAFCDVALRGRRHYFRGANGQGKTNLLEGLGFISSLRSFRTRSLRVLPRREAAERRARLWYAVKDEADGISEVEIELRPGTRKLWWDGEPVRRLGELLGRFPTVPLSSQDIQLLRGAPELRRRFVDMLLVQMDGGYFETLTRYHKALHSRNALLKQGAGERLRGPFEAVLAAEGAALVGLRARLLAAFAPHFRAAYEGISPVAEAPGLSYEANLQAVEAGAFAEGLAANLERDRETGTTQRGPHRDDIKLELQGRAAREYASEGQQRGLVLALRLGLVEWLRAEGGPAPVVLADDIVGELDADRRAGFWKLLEPCGQIVATGTAPVASLGGEDWVEWEVVDGQVRPVEAAARS